MFTNKFKTMFKHLRFSLCIAWLVFSANLSAQDFSKIDAQARATPFPKNQSIQQLADALSEGLTTEKEKVRAIFVWIADNIRYDIKSFENRKKLEPAEYAALQAPAQVLKNKKAVCAGYSNLFAALCSASGIEAMVVTGISKNHKDRISRSGHAWNLVRADGQWGLIDATWGAGEVDPDEGEYTAKFNELFFFTPPGVLILDHYPEDPLFQLLPAPLTLDEFKQNRAAVQKIVANTANDQARIRYNVKDSLDAFAQMDVSTKHSNSCMRTLRFDPASSKGLYGLSMTQYDEAVALFQQTVDEMNSALQSRDRKRIKEIAGRSVQQLKIVERKLNACISTIEKISGTDDYAKSARRLLAPVRKTLSECNKNKESIEKTYEQLKNAD